MSAPLIFDKVQIRNFMSFGNISTDIDLSNLGSTLVQGENIDTASNNGAGKCLSGCTTINIKNKRTGEISSIPIEEFYEKISHSIRKG